MKTLTIIALTALLLSCAQESTEQKAINDWIETTLNDPSSYESMNISNPNEEGYFEHSFRATNGFGAKIVNSYHLKIANGKIVDAIESKAYKETKARAEAEDAVNKIFDNI